MGGSRKGGSRYSMSTVRPLTSNTRTCSSGSNETRRPAASLSTLVGALFSRPPLLSHKRRGWRSINVLGYRTVSPSGLAQRPRAGGHDFAISQATERPMRAPATMSLS